MAHHTHKCKNCKKACVDCNASRVDNYDGWPEVLCSAEAEDWTFLCDDCAGLVQCDDCGVRVAESTLRKFDGFVYCASCYAKDYRCHVEQASPAGLVAHVPREGEK